MTANLYDSFGNVTATYHGQTIAANEPGYTDPAGVPTWTFANLAPDLDRTYDVYGYSTGTLSSSNYTISNSNAGADSSAAAITSSLGSNWQFLRTVALGSGSSSLEVSCTGGSPAEAICLLQPMSSSVYDPQENLLSQTDAMGDVTAYAYDALGRPLTTSQGQAVNVPSGSTSVQFANLPQAPGQGRTYTVYVQSLSSPFASGSVTIGTVSDTDIANPPQFQIQFVSPPTPLGNDWYELGKVTLAPGDSSSSLTATFSCLTGVTASQFAWLEQTSSTVYDADGQRPLADRRTEQRHHLRLQRPGAANFHLAGPDSPGRFARGLLRQPAADARPIQDLHGLRPVLVLQWQLYRPRQRQPHLDEVLGRKCRDDALGQRLVASRHRDLGVHRLEFHAELSKLGLGHGNLPRRASCSRHLHARRAGGHGDQCRRWRNELWLRCLGDQTSENDPAPDPDQPRPPGDRRRLRRPGCAPPPRPIPWAIRLPTTTAMETPPIR